jgi:hypothetical protein
MAVSFSPKDICRMIEVSAHYGVAILKFGNVEITFKDSFVGPSAIVDQPKASSQDYSGPASPETVPQSEELSPLEKQSLEDMRWSQLMLDDPLAFETEMIDGFMGRTGRLEDGKASDQ